MKALLFLLLATVSTLAQFGGESIRPWEPRDIRTKAGLFAQYDVGQASTVTLNGAGISKVADKSWVPGRLENLLVQSEVFSSASWAKTEINAFGATDTGAAGVGSFANTARTTDPLGGNTADFLQESDAVNYHMVNQNPVMASGPCTFSVYAKQAGRTWLALETYAPTVRAWFDVGNGVLGTVNAGMTATITSAGNGWYLCSATVTLAPSSYVYCELSPGDTVVAYDGDNTSGLFLWGAQLRRATSSSTYVATTTVVEDASRDLLQSTAANQPLVSRADNKGNLLAQSEAWSQSSWSKTRVNAFGVTDTGATGAGSFANTARTLDPLGGNTADFLQEDNTAANTHHCFQAVVGPSGTYVFDLWVAPSGRNWVMLQVNNGTDFARGWFNVQTGIAGSTVVAGGSPTGLSATVVAGPINGFYQCRFQATFPNPVTSALFEGTTGDTAVVFDGDNTSGLFIWGASLRQSTWDSDYIATTATIAVPGLNGKTTAYFDGSAHYLKTAGMASLVQPETVVMVGKQVTWTSLDFFCDGNSVDDFCIIQHTLSPKLGLYAGSYLPDNAALAVGSYGVVVGALNGANSALSVNNVTVTGDAGVRNSLGFTLGARANGANFANIAVSQVLLFNQVVGAPELAYIKWGGLKEVGALP